MNVSKHRFTACGMLLATALVVVSAVASRPASAAVFTWAGAAGPWNSNSSWTSGTSPSNGDSVLFTSLGTGTTSNVNKTLTLTGITFDASVNRSFTLSGASIVTVPNITNSSTFLQTINSPLSLSGGTVDTGAAGLRLGGRLTGSGNVTKTGSGLLDITNGSNNTAGGYSGTLTVSSGTVRLTTGVGLADVVVNSGATLQSALNDTGNGYAKSITVNNGGFLTPGNEAAGNISAFQLTGDLTLNNGSSTTMDVVGTASDYIVSSAGAMNFGGDLDLNVAAANLGEINFVDLTADWNTNTPTSWALFQGASFSGNFSTVQFTMSGTTYNFQQGSNGLWRTVTFGVLGNSSGTDNEFIFATQDTSFGGQSFAAGTLYAVPEPSTIVFAGIGAAMFGWQALSSRRNRRRRKSTESAIG